MQDKRISTAEAGDYSPSVRDMGSSGSSSSSSSSDHEEGESEIEESHMDPESEYDSEYSEEDDCGTVVNSVSTPKIIMPRRGDESIESST